MKKDHVFEELWEQAGHRGARFRPESIAGLPVGARRYLEHAIAPDTAAASAVRLQMHGEIKLGSWHPFEAEQVIRWDRGFVWKATTKLSGLPVSGSDRWIDGEGSMRWKMLGIVPVMRASGPDVSRAALGRVQIEAIWLPSVLLGPDVSWDERDAAHPGMTVAMRGESAHVAMTIDEAGRLSEMWMERWGHPEQGEFHRVPFGGIVEDEATFEGFTIPSRLRVGWYFGTDRFESEGEFFRVTVDRATFR
jgi:hypothetical protein